MNKLFFRITTILITAILIITIFIPPTESTATLYCHDYPEWIENDIITSETITDVDAAPTIQVDVDYCLAYEIQFYDTSTDKQITDYAIIDELLNMFEYADNNFIYDKERSKDGSCIIYYNDIIPANKYVSLFSGFKGKKNFPENSEETINSIYVIFKKTMTSESHYSDIERHLDDMIKSSPGL